MRTCTEDAWWFGGTALGVGLATQGGKCVWLYHPRWHKVGGIERGPDAQRKRELDKTGMYG
jgi:hypothetical protein